ncbi:putative inactive poly [ADP-ribose] polymerase SRO2 [Glycine max]|nr:putative inactive poly [ADP-ribose] polymerase SRO2 [Glycine max]
MGFVGHATNVMALYKNILSFSVARQARWVSFKIFSKAVAIKCGGDANVGYAWYGGSLDDLLEIVSAGFNGCKNHNANDDDGDDDECHGIGMPLFAANFSIDRHVLLCKVILGNVEAVPAGSKQSQPSSKQYDTGG